jgi:nucleoside-diphosphate-sugar epimerase
MKKHLVTGSSGFLGSAIVRKLISQGERVVSLDILEDNEISKVSEFYKIDVSNNFENYKKIFENVDFVHHNAALVPLTKAGNNFFKANVLGTRNILNQSIKYSVGHFSHMSSSAIFGKPEKNHNVDYSKYNPTGIYGKSKYLAELEVKKKFNDQNKFFKSCSIIRPRPIIGKERLGIFEILFDWVIDNKKIPIIGSGNNNFQFAHTDDLVDVSIETAKRNISGTFNIGTNQYSTLKNDLNNAFKLMGSKSQVVGINRNLCIPILFILDKLNLSPLSSWHYLSYDWNFEYDLDDAFKKLEWRPKYSNVEMICEAYKWYLENKMNISNNNSSHKSNVKQKFLKIIKFFF